MINLTPHELNVQDETGVIHNIPIHTVNGLYISARVEEAITQQPPIQGFTVISKTLGDPYFYGSELPGKYTTGGAMEWGQLAIPSGSVIVVSRLFLDALHDPNWMGCIWLAPGEAIRDENGRVIGSKGFSK